VQILVSYSIPPQYAMIHHDVVIDDVENLDTIEDGFIHYQLLRFFRLPTSSTLTPTFLDKVGMLPVTMLVDSNTRKYTRTRVIESTGDLSS
jgi:hypothetical protein